MNGLPRSRYARPMGARLLIVAAVAALALAGPADASRVALTEVRDAKGALLAQGTQSGFLYPPINPAAAVERAGVAKGFVVLERVSLLGGRIWASKIVIPVKGTAGARIDGLIVNRRHVRARPNTLIQLGGGSYLVVLQQAEVPGANGTRQIGSIGLRLHVGLRLEGLPAGSEVWAGVASGEIAGGPITDATAEIPANLIPIYKHAARRYHVPWSTLAAINKYETGFGTNVSTSSAGAVGWMQFLPSTWARWGVDANGDGRKDPNDPEDAIFAAARYLQAAGAESDLGKAVFAYNHADWYVKLVLEKAAQYARAGSAAVPSGPLDPATPGG